jgi:integrase
MNSTDSNATIAAPETTSADPGQDLLPGRAKKHRKGHLFQRGSIYWLEYKVNGKRFRQSLDTSDIKEARSQRARIMAPFALATEEEVLQTVKQRIETTAEKQEALTTAHLPQVVIDNAWEAFVRSRNRPDPGPATLHQYVLQYGRFATWVKANHTEIVELRDVTSTIAEEYADELAAAGISANTFNKHIRLLMLLFRVLKKRARLRDNPWVDIQRKKEEQNTRRELTSEELQKVIGSAEGEFRTLFALGIYTGLRLGDCATLRWSEVDLNRGIIIRVPRKTGRGRAKPVHIPIHGTLAGILRGIRRTPSLPSGTSRKGSRKKLAESSEEYVLPTTSANYLIRADLVTDRIQNHFENCGIRTHKPGTGKQRVQEKGVKYKSVGKRAVVEVGFHSLRHTFVSLCRKANAPLAVVEAIVGHSNPAMTRHYTHVGDLAASQAVAALPAIVGDAGESDTQSKPRAQLSDREREMESIIRKSTPETWSADTKVLLALLHGKPAGKHARN